MRITVRPAVPADFSQMSELLNPIIAAGETTALQSPVTADDLLKRMDNFKGRNAWHVARNDSGRIMGFQFVEPHVDLPDDAGDIATYVRIGAIQLGIGSKLFEATKQAAAKLGYVWLNATIRADNSGGLAYYSSRGFKTWTTDEDTPLSDGTIVTKISKRYDLRAGI